jgi:dTDP-glucose 4,6-dehydratase
MVKSKHAFFSRGDRMEKILVTGGAGFIGSHYLERLLQTDEDIEVVNVDFLTYAADIDNTNRVQRDKRYHFEQLDIANSYNVNALFQKYFFTQVINFAAESHVDRSIQSAEAFINTNIVGTYTLLQAAKKYQVARFVQISTDEVYGSFPFGRADENTPLSPRNPYAASKASADLLCKSFAETYDFPVIITRCTNNYGPRQHREKFIPSIITACIKQQPISLYGDGLQERDWLHVTDHCRAVELIRKYGELGEIYHIGAECTISNKEVALQVISVMKSNEDQITYVMDRLGHDVRYSLDTSKLRNQLGWKPTVSFTDGLAETVDWYLSKWRRTL